MPPTMYLLMALEAARQQSRITLSTNPACLYLSKVQFQDPLAFVSFQESDATIEMHLRARQLQDTSSYWFEIFSITGDDQRGSNCHCSGQFGWTDTMPRNFDVKGSDVLHDQLLLQQAPEHNKPSLSRLENLAYSSAGVFGTFETSIELMNQDFMDPLVFESILQSPPPLLFEQDLPATYKILSMQSMVVPATPPTARAGCFSVVKNGATTSGGRCDINITLDESRIVLSDMSFEVDRLVSVPPVLKSLYFKPVMLSDIARMTPCDSMSIAECLTLVTHKWPMCDIVAINLTPNDLSKILEGLPGVRPGERPSFRSFQVIGKVTGLVSDRVRVVDDLEDNAKFHLVFAGNKTTTDRLRKHLLPTSILITNTLRGGFYNQAPSSINKICDVVGIGEEAWSLFRGQQEKMECISVPKVKVFACPDQSIQSIASIEVDEYIPLTSSLIKEFCKRNHERYSAIVIDDIKKSVITIWPGKDLIPWLQNLLKYADNILWITKQKESNPFINIAGSLLRTIQSEQPAIKVTWLVLRDEKSEVATQETIMAAFTALLSGSNEIRLEVGTSTTSVLRYLPDDELSASMGLIPSQGNCFSMLNRDYQLALPLRQSPVLLLSNEDRFHEVDAENIQVEVEASIIDVGDILAYNGEQRHHSKPSLGTFFAGRVVSELSSKFPYGCKVVGSASGCHCRVLHVASSQVHIYNEETAPEEAAANFACIATALCIIDGTARARQGDTIQLFVQGRLKEAIKHVGYKIGTKFLLPDPDKHADFDVTVTERDGLRVRGASIDIGKYLESERGIAMIAEAWSKKTELTEPLEVFELANFNEAFRAAHANPYSTVLLHVYPGKVSKSVVVYKKAIRLFAGDGAYVVIGGLGGLGRFVCSWMVENGAKRIVAISRSGVKSDEARQTWEAINSMGISFEVVRADAGDRKAMSKALSIIRKTSAIKGIINMAMLLGDAPMAVMEGWQWDIALRLKIDSSWIMHEETLDDPLDFFIMFSSIASVLGNRNQGGYNVGNAFLNALAEYRQSMGRTAISIALGAMSKRSFSCLYAQERLF